MQTKPGWPNHRPRCRDLDDAVVTTETGLVGECRWYLRYCTGCGAVALDPVEQAAS